MCACAESPLVRGFVLLRFFAGVACCFLLMTGAFLIWQSHAERAPGLPPATAAFGGSSWLGGSAPLVAPEADEKTRAQKRFNRYDKNKDGKVEVDEYLAARRRNFDKLDLDHNGALSFQEYAAKGIDKFNSAGGRKGWLTEAEFATTAPPRNAKRKGSCSCRAPEREPAQTTADNNDEN
jgi:hypothetical protein